MADDETFTEAQGDAYDRILELGGDRRWVPIDEVGTREVVDELREMRIVQTSDGGGFVALDGFEPAAPEVGECPRCGEKDFMCEPYVSMHDVWCVKCANCNTPYIEGGGNRRHHREWPCPLDDEDESDDVEGDADVEMTVVKERDDEVDEPVDIDWISIAEAVDEAPVEE